jgi:hypothetical protein
MKLLTILWRVQYPDRARDADQLVRDMERDT